MLGQREELTNAMAAISAGDRDGLARVYHLTSVKLFGTIVRIVRNRERAEDLLQDVYLKVWKRAAGFDPDKGSPITWLCTIARNTAIDDVRRAGRGKEIADDTLPEVVDEDIKPADDWLCHVEDCEALRRCMEELKQDHRRSIHMAFFEGYSYSELADKVEVPLGTMKSWIRRGLAGLRGCLSG